MRGNYAESGKPKEKDVWELGVLHSRSWKLPPLPSPRLAGVPEEEAQPPPPAPLPSTSGGPGTPVLGGRCGSGAQGMRGGHKW